MSKKSFEVDVEPKILIWARESMGIEITEVAKRFGLSENTVKKWESGQKKPTVVQIKELAGFYKRPLAVFFLPEPPEEPPLPNDFRTLPEEKRKPFSRETRLIIRRARRLQSLAIELAEGINKEIHPNVGRASLSDDPEVVANNTRMHIGIDIQTQFAWSSDADAFEAWKKAVEGLGVLVFQFPLSVEETRGFSLPSDTFPAIILNRRDHVRARIFSLFHEYGHLLLDTDGICNWETLDGSSKEIGSVEKFCNHFAGAFLVPKNALLNHRLVKFQATSEWSDEHLEKIARDFRVSREVILRRLVTLRLVSWDSYRAKYEKWKEIARKEQEPKFLLDIEINYKQYLEEGPVSEVLMNAFKNNNLVLTKEAKITQGNNNKWEIKDGNRIYFIIDNGVQLKIFKKRAGRGGRQNIPKKCILENSIPFASLVFDSYRREKITYNDVADYLGIRTKHIPKVERFIEVGV